MSELCLSPLLFLQIKVSVERFVVGLEFAVSCEFSDRSSEKIKIIAELTILKARCKNLQFTCAILIVSSRQNCRGHIMHHHDTFHKMLPPPLGTRINNTTVPALKTTTVNRPVPALKKKRTSRREQKIQPPGPGAEKTQPPRPVPPRKKYNRPVPPRKKKYNRPVPPRKKTTTAPSRFGKKNRPPRPASEKNNNRPVPPRKKKKTSRPAKNFA